MSSSSAARQAISPRRYHSCSAMWRASRSCCRAVRTGCAPAGERRPTVPAAPATPLCDDLLQLTKDLIQSGAAFGLLPRSACADEIESGRIRWAPLCRPGGVADTDDGLDPRDRDPARAGDPDRSDHPRRGRQAGRVRTLAGQADPAANSTARAPTCPRDLTDLRPAVRLSLAVRVFGEEHRLGQRQVFDLTDPPTRWARGSGRPVPRRPAA